MLKKLLIFSILNILIFQTTASTALARDRIENHLSDLLEIGDFETTVSNSIPIYFQRDSPRSEESARSIAEEVNRMLILTGYESIERCQNIEVKIFVMDHSLLHDRSVMNFLSWESMPENIWGAYDSFHDQSTGEFYINGSATSGFTKRIFAHEFWHHIQDITCQTKSEREAEDFSNRFCNITGEC